MNTVKFLLTVNLFIFLSLYFEKYFSNYSNNLNSNSALIKKRFLNQNAASLSSSSVKKPQAEGNTQSAGSGGTNTNTSEQNRADLEKSVSSTSKSGNLPQEVTKNGSKPDGSSKTLPNSGNANSENESSNHEESDEEEDDDDDDEDEDLCKFNNGGCGEDKICENLGEDKVKCVCKEGYKLVNKECVKISESSSLNSIFSTCLIFFIVLISIN